MISSLFLAKRLKRKPTIILYDVIYYAAIFNPCLPDRQAFRVAKPIALNPGVAPRAIHMTPLQGCLELVSDPRAAPGATHMTPLQG